MLKRDDIIWAYQLFLNRYPESEEIINLHLKNNISIRDLCKIFISSKEFQQKTGHNYFDYTSPPLDIDVIVDSASYKKLLTRIQKSWEALGESEPHFSVLTKDKFKQNSIDKNKAEFYESGISALHLLLASLRRNGIIIHDSDVRTMDILEIGCGVGRITYFLSKYFNSVEAVDISKPHLDLAKEYVTDTNVVFKQIKTLDDYTNLSACDIVFSVIVLQHSPPPIIAHVLSCMFKALRPGGVACFQLPTYAGNYRFRLEEYLENNYRGIEMHCFPQRYVYEIADNHSCIPLEVSENGMTGKASLSNLFIFQKKSLIKPLTR